MSDQPPPPPPPPSPRIQSNLRVRLYAGKELVAASDEPAVWLATLELMLRRDAVERARAKAGAGAGAEPEDRP